MFDPSLMPIVAVVFGAIAFSAVVVGLFYPYLSGDRKKDQRIANVTDTRAKKVASRTAADVTATRKKAVAESLKDIDSRKKQIAERPTLRVRLQRGGLDIEPRQYWMAAAGLGISLGLLVYMMLLKGLPPSRRSSD